VSVPARRPDPAAARDPVVFALLAACAALMLVRVQLAAVPALWIDETFSLHHARASLARLWTEGWRLESSPPLYYTVLWAWTRLVGDGEFAARLLSFALTAAALPFVHGAARTLGGPRAGAAAALAWLLPTLALEYAVEVRPFALQLCWIAIALAAFARLIVERHRLAAAGSARVALAIVPIVLAGAASFYTHSTSFAFLCGLAVAGLYAAIATRAGRRAFLAWALACGVLALLCVPQLVSMTGVLATNASGLAWIGSPFDPWRLAFVAWQVVLGQVHWRSVVALPLAAIVYGAFAHAAWRQRARAELVAVGVVVPAVGAAALLAASAVQPVLLHRTALWLLMPMAIVFGCAAARADWRATRTRVLALALLATVVASTGAYLRVRPEQRPWPDVIAEVGRHAAPSDRVVVVDEEVACVHERYARGTLAGLPRARLDLGAAARFHLGQRIALDCNRLPALGPDALGTGGGADWVLTGDDRERADLDSAIAASGGALRVTARIDRGGRVHATRVVRD
jgi:uncharacterized membrane protein